MKRLTYLWQLTLLIDLCSRSAMTFYYIYFGANAGHEGRGATGPQLKKKDG
jgi:hypothetical protein